ncbi:hypothetical protein CAPTEDRAFT_89077 [Capitella teleta]|uniref:Heparan sulfate glucosamine 3-O-sulfotransferase 5 n=1 Tax=Capitella teleta TaxID=283909 RepID=X2BAQ1_CAPTE|nr:hypothetical protein CAPTEDRAFT_89077 [Capitella teleta]|eukprot:ELT90114.1 hypothetical protein CAPTEDRAFT_89077 [Capitella teleta]
MEARIYSVGDDDADVDDAYYDDTLEGAQRPAHQKHQKRRLPQCLIIGVRKGGTRALLEFLNLHPNIAAEKKEMHFFDDEVNYNRGLEFYRKRMPYSYEDQVTLEKTPAYFVEEVVPGRVSAMNSSIKLILILRDPVERAISDYMQIYTTRHERGKTHETFENLAFDAMTGDVNKSYKAIRRSIYHRHMERWLEHFPLHQFHFVSAENLVQNPVEELRKVEDFLQIDHRLTQDHFYFNQTRGFYCMHLQHRQKCLAPSKGRAHIPIDQDVIYKLREFFRPHNQEMYELVGMNFGWP